MLESVISVMAGVLTRVISDTGYAGIAAAAFFVWHRLRALKAPANAR